MTLCLFLCLWQLFLLDCHFSFHFAYTVPEVLGFNKVQYVGVLSFFFFFFFFFRAKPVAYGGSQARGLQLLAYTTATGMQDLSLVCDLHHNSQQHWILNPLSKARDRTCVLMDASQIC